MRWRAFLWKKDTATMTYLQWCNEDFFQDQDQDQDFASQDQDQDQDLFVMFTTGRLKSIFNVRP